MAYTETTRVADSDFNVVDPATTAGQRLMRMMLQLLRPLSYITSGSGRLQVDVNTISSGTVNVGLVTTVTTVTTVTGVTNIGGISGFELHFNAAHAAYAQIVRSRITV